MRIGLVFDIREDYGIKADDIQFCDFNYLSDMQYLQNTLEDAGHYVLPIGSPKNFANMLRNNSLNSIDIIMNFGEGFLSRNREGIVPSLCEAYGIPYTGSDAFAMVLTLDKHLTLLYAQSLGVHIPHGFLFQPQFHTISDIHKVLDKKKMVFPIVAKPNREGTSMGIVLAHNSDELVSAISNIVKTYHQDVRCDEYIGGNEIAVPILGTGLDAKALGIVEYCECDGGIMPFYTSEKKEHGNHKTVYRTFGSELDKRIKETALKVHRGLGCCDISRIDLKLQDGIPYLLEVTPIPSMNKGGTFEFCAQKNGMSYADLLNAVLDSAVCRYSINR